MTASRQSRSVALSTFALFALLFGSFAGLDEAEARRGRRHRRAKTVVAPTIRAQLETFTSRTNMATATHNGKLYIKVDAPKLKKSWDTYCRIGNGKVLEFSGRGHLFTRYNKKKCADFLEKLDLDTFSAPTTPRVSVVVRLADKEHKELNTYIDATQISSKREIGTFNYGGGRPRRYYPGSTTANCTTWISAAKLDGSKSLGQTCGVGSAASPSSWIQSLARRGNERVEAVLLHHFKGDVKNWAEVDRFMTSSMSKPH